MNLPHTPILVAFSGGADSRLLLDMAVEFAREHGLPVAAAHLHHGIRGGEADRDLAFCRRVAKSYGIKLYFEHVDIPARAKASGRSIETEARVARYDFFARVMTANGFPLLLTAHHADDALETILARLMRGTGTRGMSGIPSARPVEGGVAYRPLLDMTKADILAACRERGLYFVTDSTNGMDDGTRNRIRRNLVPVMEAIAGKGVPQAAARRLSRAAKEDDDCLCDLAEKRLTAFGAPRGMVPLQALEGESNAITRRMISMIYEAATANTPDPEGTRSLTAAHLDALLNLCERAVPLSEVSLPGGMRAQIRRGMLCFLPPANRNDTGEVQPLPATEAIPIPLGDTPWDGGHMTIRCEYVSLGTARPDLSLAPPAQHVFATALFPADYLPLPLWARRRAPGDIILCHGMHKKLKKILCDKHMDNDLRDRLPLLCIDEGQTPLWFPGVAFRDGFPPPFTGRALRITVLKSGVT